MLIAPLFLVACGGTAQEAGPVQSGAAHVTAAAEAGPTLTSAEAQSVLEASVSDRTAEALATPPPGGPSLDAAESSDKFKAARERERLLVAERKVRLRGFGFHYTSAVTDRSGQGKSPGRPAEFSHWLRSDGFRPTTAGRP